MSYSETFHLSYCICKLYYHIETWGYLSWRMYWLWLGCWPGVCEVARAVWQCLKSIWIFHITVLLGQNPDQFGTLSHLPLFNCLQSLQREQGELTSQVHGVRDAAVDLMNRSEKYHKMVEPELTSLNQRWENVHERIRVSYRFIELTVSLPISSGRVHHGLCLL